MISDIGNAMDIARALWKYRLWILVPLILGLVGAFLALQMVEPLYEATTLVMVEPQKVPSDYVKATVTSNLESRMRTLEQQIKNRSTMERLINAADLFTDERHLYSMEEMVEKAQRSLRVRVARGQIVRIGFTSGDPAEAARAANTITEFFIEENLNLREKQAENTTVFLRGEVERTKKQLEEQEARVSEFRLRNAGSLPDQRQANLSAISQLERQLDQNHAKREATELRRLLLTRERTPETEDLVLVPSPHAKRIQELELELQRLRSQYTEKHPDVVRLQAEVDNLRQEEYLRVGSSTTPLTREVSESEVDLEVASLDLELERLENERIELMASVERYQRRLEATPRIEQELIGLTRDYDNLKSSYESLLSKLINAGLAEELERKQQSEQFRILEPAVPPDAPASPVVLLYYLTGLLVGGGLGIGLALIRDFLDDTISDESTLLRAFPGVGTVISIPHMDPSAAADGADRGSEERRSA